MIYFTSDLHLFHENILKFCPESRPFENIEEMHHHLLEYWNNLIMPEDDVYILGDVTFKNSLNAKNYLNSLNGKKYLIYGNHDKNIITNEEDIQDCFEFCKHYHEIHYNKNLIVLSHYPFMFWNRSDHGSYHLFGHCHGTLKHDGRALDVGLDATNFKILSIEDIDNVLNAKPIISRLY